MVNAENYYELDKYMSVSAFKKFDKCEVLGLQPFVGTKSDAFLIGGYVDAYVEGTLEQYKKDNSQVFKTTISTNESTVECLRQYDPKYITRNNTLVSKYSSEAKSKHSDCFTTTVELKANFKHADTICKYIDNDHKIGKYLNGEKQGILTGKIKNIPFKIKMDSYIPGVLIADLKVMRSITNRNGDYFDFISQYGYDIQLACYQEIVRQNSGNQLPCYIVAVTKENPINSAIIYMPQEVLDKALYHVEERIEQLYKVKMGKVAPVGCGKCKACIANRQDTKLISFNDLAEY